MSLVIKGAKLVKDGKRIMLQIPPIALGAIVTVKPDANGDFSRATWLHATNRGSADGERVIMPIAGVKGDSPYLAVTLSLDADGAEEMGLKFAVAETAKSAKPAKRTRNVSQLHGKVTTRPIADGE